MFENFRSNWEGHEAEILQFAQTPGIPWEWIVAVTRCGSVRKAWLRRTLRDAPPSTPVQITEDDARKMLEITPTDYRGPLPLPCQLWLLQFPGAAGAIAKQLGVPVHKIYRWRNEINFDPLTGVRL